MKVYRLTGILGTQTREVLHFTQEGLTYRELAELMRRPEWAGIDLAVSVHGRRLPPEELDHDCSPDDEIVLCPALGEVLTIIGIAIAVIGTVASALYARQQVRKALRSLAATARGDETSPTYAWDGIHTSYGAGFPVPIVYGQIDLGGQVLSQLVYLAPGGNEVFEVVLGLCEGRIYKIGGIDGGANGEVDDLGSFGGLAEPGPFLPTDVRVNGVALDSATTRPGAVMSLRYGEIAQSAYPSLANTGIVLSVNQELNTEGGNGILIPIADTNRIRTLSLLLSFPQGLYKNGPTGSPIAEQVQFAWDYRLFDTGPWINIQPSFFVQKSGPALSAFTWEQRYTFGLPQDGPITVRLRRIAGSANENSASQCVVRQLAYGLEYVFSYPRLASVYLRLLSSARFYGSQPQFRLKGQWKMVRVYGVAGETQPGLSSRLYWDLPQAGDPFYGIWSNPPGRNPAWVFLDYLLARPALGPWLSVYGIDYETIRDWADYCDMSIRPGFVRYTCDLAFDKPWAAWDALQAIAACGRAHPIIVGDKISVWYEYATLHGRGENNVPSRGRTQLFTTANLIDLRVDYLTRNRPTVYDVEFLDEDKEYARDPMPVEDPDAVNLNATYELEREEFRRESIQLIGCTRAEQARRQALFLHRFNRLVRKQVTFKVGPEALAAQVGDVIAVQDHFLRPYDKDSAAVRITSASGSVNQVTLDKAITVVSADSPMLILRDAAGEIVEVGITNGDGVILAGATVTLDDTVDVNKGTVAAFGAEGKITEDYQIISLTRDAEMRHEITAYEWHPEIHDESAVDIEDDTDTEDTGTEGSTDFITPLTQRVEGLTVRRLSSGAWQIGWLQASGAPNAAVRVFARQVDAPGWQMLGEAQAGFLVTTSLAPGLEVELVGVRQQTDGSFGVVNDDDVVTVTVDEFAPIAPPPVQNVRVTEQAGGLLIEWDPPEGEGVDWFEIRRGASWPGADVLYRGEAPRFFWEVPPVCSIDGGLTSTPHLLHIRARGPSGLYSQTWQPTEVTWNGGEGVAVEDALIDELASDAAAATLDGLECTDGVLTFAEGSLLGTLEGPIVNTGAVAELRHWVNCRYEQQDLGDVDDADEDVDSGEAMWQCDEGRDPSPHRPGSDLRRTVDSMTTDIDELPDSQLVGVKLGQVGERILVLAEIDYDTTGAGDWTGYREVRHGETVIAKRTRLRLTMAREDLTTTALVTGLSRGALYGIPA